MTVDEERAWNISNRRINDLIRQLQERDATIKQLKGDIDHNVKRALEIAEEKDATIKQLQEENQRLKSSMKTLLQAWQRGDSYEFYEDLIEKHKLIEP